MRTKEVDEAIERCKYIIENSSQWYLGPDNPKAIETVLSYIELLESNKIETISKDFHQVLDKKMNEIDLENKIRDKIKEYEEKLKKFNNNFGDCVRNQEYITELEIKIQELKSIIGE